MFLDEQRVFIAGNLFWYPVEGEPGMRTAPDVFAVFGRPKGERGSYLQWEEDGIAPQVAIEVRPPGNRFGEMLRKFQFYQRYGVEEYYLYDPDNGLLEGWLREGDVLNEIADMNGWVSPRLEVRFELVQGELHLHGPDGRKFATYVELVEQAERERREKEPVQQQRDRERQEQEQAQRRADRLAAQLRARGIEPEN